MPHIHANGITFDWSIQKFLDLGKSDNLVESYFFISRTAHAQDRTV